MRKILVLICMLLATGCVSPRAYTTANTKAIQDFKKGKDAVTLGVVSDNPLADSLSNELVAVGFKVVERNMISAILEEHKLSMTGFLVNDNLKKIGKILNIDAIVVVSGNYSQSNSAKVQSASVKLVDIETGVQIGGVNYVNGSGGMSGSPADEIAKENVPQSARKIAINISKMMNGM